MQPTDALAQCAAAGSGGTMGRDSASGMRACLSARPPASSVCSSHVPVGAIYSRVRIKIDLCSGWMDQ